MRVEKIYNDTDPLETQEWLEAFESMVNEGGTERAKFILQALTAHAHRFGVQLSRLNTPYLNTIPPHEEPMLAGDPYMERRIRSLIRWNALAIVMRANDNDDELGGHIATFASSATLYDIGFNHFFRAPNASFGGDLIYYQGHSAPGIYARSFLEGRISEAQLENFRREVDGKGLSSYPHPWLMPDYWQFPTVSMGLGPIMAIYQAHVMKYLSNRELTLDQPRKVWAFLGDGEMDEPESLGAIALAGREKLDNLIFVINCNLQRLDGPVRGNGKIIQELESVFRGAGWNVIKVVWGRKWDPLLAQDKSGVLKQRMEECVDGEYQAFKTHGGDYTRQHFFGKYPELKAMVEHLSDEGIYQLNRGGHDPYKVYAAYAKAMAHKGQPTVILAKTVKGYGTGAGEAVNKTHQLKKLDIDSLKAFRDRFDMPFTDEELAKVPFYKPADNSPELRYMHERRKKLGGYLPTRQNSPQSLVIPELDVFAPVLQGSERAISTTMAFVRLLNILIKQADIGERVVPIVPDEARTFGMEGMFRQMGIYSHVGQLYTPEDSNQMMYYKEDKKGRMLEEGINEAGAMSAWIAVGTSYCMHNLPMIPFYIFYSMFGFQRIGDLAWAAGDIQAQGFLLGATSGRTTLNGEGLQHQDGHSHLLASTIPNCVAYDPCYAYELAVIIHHGLQRMYAQGERVFYYLTTMNENYSHPPMPAGVEEGIRRGMYLLKPAPQGHGHEVQLLGSGVILREVEAAAELLLNVYGIRAAVWSVTSFNELRKEALACEHWNHLHPLETPKVAWVTQQLRAVKGAIVAASDYMRIVSEQIRAFLPQGLPYITLGTDGFGRSDSRDKLREHFQVNRYFIAIAALNALAEDGVIGRSVVQDALERFAIDAEKPFSLSV
ncbi:pyruvate dehydrogenase E1 component [Agitococcus lubricus]|uniref:Pyruvate dehydrogenase E1 component n=1 Tax=Agitococcus lubricus TaxID=1077255 RepID=A0A2T5J284_9GAMM|nr:pyruvate dehydrogenase (acetyl-transferring), homodimeric type [Agitococcus lubricus]PTQ90625.1 pyruvate dehydrogenase E1 component [Agitococcus lubricus]